MNGMNVEYRTSNERMVSSSRGCVRLDVFCYLVSVFCPLNKERQG